MVQRQAERWPYRDGRRRFTSKTTMGVMRSVLLNRAFGFTKQGRRQDVPAPQAEQGLGRDSHSNEPENENENENDSEGWGTDAGGIPHDSVHPWLQVQGTYLV